MALRGSSIFRSGSCNLTKPPTIFAVPRESQPFVPRVATQCLEGTVWRQLVPFHHHADGRADASVAVNRLHQ